MLKQKIKRVVAASLVAVTLCTAPVLSPSSFDTTSITASAAATLGKVKGLDTKTIGKTKVKLTWKEVPGAQKYVIYALTPSEKEFKKIGAITGTVVDMTTLKPDSKYTFYVRAYKKVNGKEYLGPSSAKLTVETLPKKVTQAYLEKRVKAAKKVGEIYASWWVDLDSGYYDAKDYFSTKASDGYYDNWYRVKNFNSKKALMKYLSHYFTNKLCKDIIKSSYCEKNGKLYKKAFTFGYESGYSYFTVKLDSVGSKKCTFKVNYRNGSYVDEKLPDKTVTKELTLCNGYWVVNETFFDAPTRKSSYKGEVFYEYGCLGELKSIL